ncbi:MAG TPA: hypothetical protein PKC43_12015 [Phycisphaerales bacterium]|nr:hypothetical protein [Phycisphaerales bacterium]HMP38157.1 hypothetical protein [Phycisphaerales bacterium]
MRVPPPDLGPLDAAGATGGDALERLADERIVHAALQTLAPGARLRLDRAVQLAMGAIDGEPAPAARRRPRPVDDARPDRHRPFAALLRLAPMLLITAVFLAMAQLLVETPSAEAAAARSLDAVVSATQRLGPRRYLLTIEREGPLQPIVRRGTVDVGPEGRFVVRFGPPNRAPIEAFGYDGEAYWIFGARGPVRRSLDERVLAVRGELGELTSLLVVDRLLRRLRQDYDVVIADDAPARDGTRFVATRRAGARERPWHPGPDRVTFEVAPDDRVVTSLEATWLSAPGSPRHGQGLQRAGLPGAGLPRQGPTDSEGAELAGDRQPALHPKRLRFELLRNEPLSGEPGWFGHQRHHDDRREVVDEEHAPPRLRTPRRLPSPPRVI